MAEGRELVMYVNGQLMLQSQAIPIMKSAEFQSRSGYYDSERTFNGEIFKLRQHLERLYRGLFYSQIDCGMSLEDMESKTLEVLEANRPLLAPGDEFSVSQTVTFRLPSTPDGKPGVNVVINCQFLDFSSFARSYVLGVKLVTADVFDIPRRSIGGGKEGGQQIIPLMTDPDGNITECAGANFMFVRDGHIKLPDRRTVLQGVSMHTVLELAEALEIAVDEDSYPVHEVYEADEAFITGTRYCSLPVASVDGFRLGHEGLPGPVTSKLLDAWRDRVGVDFVQQALDQVPSGETEKPSQGP